MNPLRPPNYPKDPHGSEVQLKTKPLADNTATVTYIHNLNFVNVNIPTHFALFCGQSFPGRSG